jgi:gliding motility-associated-like protein
MKLCIFILCCFIMPLGLHAQYYLNQNKVWVFGNFAGLDFASGTPVPISKHSLIPDGTVCVSDAFGHLLFYSDGDSVFDQAGVAMPNSPVHVGSFCPVSAPVIGFSNKYYLFTLGPAGLSDESLFYSIIDMSLNGGDGDLVTGYIGLPIEPSELSYKMTIVPGNNCDMWLLVHKRGISEFHAYHITSAGIDFTPVVSTYTGGGVTNYSQGWMKASHDRTKIAVGNFGRGLELHDFNPNTGVVSNCRTISVYDQVTGVEFSADNTKLYTTEIAGFLSTMSGILQYDISVPTVSAILASRTMVCPNPGYRDISLATDGKMYLPGYTNDFRHMDRIDSPNLAGAACHYVIDALDLSPDSSVEGLPAIYYIPQISAGAITGSANVCTGASISLQDTTGLPGGIWSSSATGIATVVGGTVTGMSAGIAVISYTVSGSCGSATSVFTVNVLATPAAIRGTLDLCSGNSSTLTDATSLGVWTSSDVSVVSIGSSSGVASGASAGTAIISYGIGGCYATATATVISFPTAGTITGASTVCVRATDTLTDATGSGTWHSDNTAVATVSSSGVVSGVSAGIANISYTVVYTCGPATAVFTVTVNATPQPITGHFALCQDTTTILSDATRSGTWITGNAAVAAIDASSGLVTAIGQGTAAISYSIGTACDATVLVTVNPRPNAGVITSNVVNAFCIGFRFMVQDTAMGGIWSLSNNHIALSGDTITAISPGEDTIYYTVSNVCGVAVATDSFAIQPPLPPVTGDLSVCVGDTTILLDGQTGGMWEGGGHVYIDGDMQDKGITAGLSAGTAIITYQMDLGCYTTAIVTVNPLPVVAPITGAATLCQGLATNLTDSTTAGTWSSSNPAVATVGSSGHVATFATGIAVITYTTLADTNGCKGMALFTINVSPPSFIVTGTISPVKCYGGNDGAISISASGSNSAYKFLWANGDTTSALSGLVTGAYTLIIKEIATQCTESDTFQITAPDSLSITADVKNDYCKENKGSITVTVSGGTAAYSYLWSNKSTASEISDLAAGNYVLTVTDNNGCLKTLTLAITDSNCETVVIHDGISPNGDGINDTWVIEGLQHYPGNTVQVFDKWGSEVFSETNYKNDWSGTNKNSLLPDGTYYYLVKLNADNSAGGGKNAYTGSLMIKR